MWVRNGEGGPRKGVLLVRAANQSNPSAAALMIERARLLHSSSGAGASETLQSWQGKALLHCLSGASSFDLVQKT